MLTTNVTWFDLLPCTMSTLVNKDSYWPKLAKKMACYYKLSINNNNNNNIYLPSAVFIAQVLVGPSTKK